MNAVPTRLLAFNYAQAFEATAYHENMTADEGDPMKYIAVTPRYFVFGRQIDRGVPLNAAYPEWITIRIPSHAITGHLPIDLLEDAMRAMADPLPIVAIYADRYRSTGLETFPNFLE